MTRRSPVWVAILPLLLGLLAYWLYWQREAEAFRQAVIAAIPGASSVEVGGFPYRIEARLASIRIQGEPGGSLVSLSAGATVINRQPWRTGHVVVAAENPKLDFALPGIESARLAIEAPAMLASLRRPGSTLERLSMQFETATVWLPAAGGPFAARNFEVHVRETPAQSSASRSPTLPVQAEARLSGALDVGGKTLSIDVPLFITSATRLASVDAWRSGGTAEIKGGVLSAAGKALAGFDATLAPLPDGKLAVAGTIDTDCPVSVRGLVLGAPVAVEFRSRRTQRLPVSGMAGRRIDVGAPEGPSGGPARNLEPPCPDLRR